MLSKSTVAAISLMVLSLLFVGAALPPSSPQASIRTTFVLTLTPTPSAMPEGAQPILVWITFDPWAMVIGGDSPRFALYDDGTVIYRTDEGYFSAQLSEDELDDFMDSLPLADFVDLDDGYDIAPMTDQPSHTLLVWQDGEMQSTGVYGDVLEMQEVRDATPQPILDIVDRLAAFEDENAEPWLPEYIEIMIWPYDTSEGAPWPADWPDLDDLTTVERHEDNYSLYLDADEFEEFQALMDDYSGAARIDGRTWSVSYRYPFPHESEWQGQF
jgi:hypothetical protein